MPQISVLSPVISSCPHVVSQLPCNTISLFGVPCYLMSPHMVSQLPWDTKLEIFQIFQHKIVTISHFTQFSEKGHLTSASAKWEYGCSLYCSRMWWLPLGVSSWGGGGYPDIPTPEHTPPREGTWDQTYPLPKGPGTRDPPLNRSTIDRDHRPCENITFPQLLLQQ